MLLFSLLIVGDYLLEASARGQWILPAVLWVLGFAVNVWARFGMTRIF